jgi:hypothetical protein
VGDHHAAEGGSVRRIEHFNDPDAPTANRPVPAASAIVVDQLRILHYLEHRTQPVIA